VIFSEHVFLYCERGSDTALLAEPANAASNLGFIFAALAGFWLLWRRPSERDAADSYLLAALILLIGLGSLAFHLFANRGSELADVVPIGLFMLVYVGIALNRFLAVSPGWTMLIAAGFAALVYVTLQLKCGSGMLGSPVADSTGPSKCLNGSIGYLPALLGLIVIGALMRERGHPAAHYLLWAALVFAISVTLRSLDVQLCNSFTIAGRKVGTHAAWHLLNAGVLFLLLRSSLEAGRGTKVP
jgi:Ceramidase